MKPCGSCDFFVPHPGMTPKKGEPRIGTCHAHPALLVQNMVPVGNPLSAEGARMVPANQGMWPPVSAFGVSSGCGEHEGRTDGKDYSNGE